MVHSKQIIQPVTIISTYKKYIIYWVISQKLIDDQNQTKMPRLKIMSLYINVW